MARIRKQYKNCKELESSPVLVTPNATAAASYQSVTAVTTGGSFPGGRFEPGKSDQDSASFKMLEKLV